MIALIDADIFTYRIGFSTETVDFDIAKWRMDELVHSTLREVGTDNYKMFLTDSAGNFRRKIYPEYHATRTQLKPKWHEQLKEYLILSYNAEIAHGQEADDALGIAQCELDSTGKTTQGIKPNSVIVSIDKDLKQIPGWHYNIFGTLQECCQSTVLQSCSLQGFSQPY